MGLDRDFLALLTAEVGLRRHLTKDKWGNEGYGPEERQPAYIDPTSSEFGGAVSNDRQEKTITQETSVMMDAVGVKVKDQLVWDGIVRTVTRVETSKDETGKDLYQMVTASTDRKG